MGIYYLFSFTSATSVVLATCLFRLWKFAQYGLHYFSDRNFPKVIPAEQIPGLIQDFLAGSIYPLLWLLPILLLVEALVRQTWALDG